MTTIVRRRRLGAPSCRSIVAASTTGIRYVNNYDGIPHDDVYIRWGCTSALPNRDAAVVNRASGIHRVANKAEFRRLLNDRGLCPRSYFPGIEQPGELGFPVVVRTKTHSQGRGLWLCANYREMERAIRRAGPGCYVNEFIDKVSEYRVFVSQGKVVWVARKIPGNPDQVAWNVNQGGVFENVNWGAWPLAVCQQAIDVWALTGLHFAGIDIMVDREGTPYCLEANSAPSMTSPYRTRCTAKAFDWMADHGTGLDPIVHPQAIEGGWRGVIHPAIWSREVTSPPIWEGEAG